jgi:hypothetical protein
MKGSGNEGSGKEEIVTGSFFEKPQNLPSLPEAVKKCMSGGRRGRLHITSKIFQQKKFRIDHPP